MWPKSFQCLQKPTGSCILQVAWDSRRAIGRWNRWSRQFRGCWKTRQLCSLIRLPQWHGMGWVHLSYWWVDEFGLLCNRPRDNSLQVGHIYLSSREVTFSSRKSGRRILISTTGSENSLKYWMDRKWWSQLTSNQFKAKWSNLLKLHICISYQYPLVRCREITFGWKLFLEHPSIYCWAWDRF